MHLDQTLGKNGLVAQGEGDDLQEHFLQYQGDQAGHRLESHLLQQRTAPGIPGHGHQDQGCPQMEPQRGGGITILQEAQPQTQHQGQ